MRQALPLPFTHTPPRHLAKIAKVNDVIEVETAKIELGGCSDGRRIGSSSGCSGISGAYAVRSVKAAEVDVILGRGDLSYGRCRNGRCYDGRRGRHGYGSSGGGIGNRGGGDGRDGGDGVCRRNGRYGDRRDD